MERFPQFLITGRLQIGGLWGGSEGWFGFICHGLFELGADYSCAEIAAGEGPRSNLQSGSLATLRRLRSLLFSDLQYGEEGFLGDVDFADALHALFAFFLFFEELAFAGDVAAVALGDDVFADGGDRLARDDLGADGGLDGDLAHLAGDEFAHLGDEGAASVVGE